MCVPNNTNLVNWLSNPNSFHWGKARYFQGQTANVLSRPWMSFCCLLTLSGILYGGWFYFITRLNSINWGRYPFTINYSQLIPPMVKLEFKTLYIWLWERCWCLFRAYLTFFYALDCLGEFTFLVFGSYSTQFSCFCFSWCFERFEFWNCDASIFNVSSNSTRVWHWFRFFARGRQGKNQNALTSLYMLYSMKHCRHMYQQEFCILRRLIFFIIKQCDNIFNKSTLYRLVFKVIQGVSLTCIL